jgi:lysophospholipase L1-like esterase
MLDQIKKHIQNDIYRIVFLGDSVTSGEWVHPNWREIVEYVLKEELTKQIDNWKIPSWNIRCFNAGLDGSTTKDQLERLNDYVFLHKPNLAFIMIGGNDKYFLKPEDTYTNLKDILSQLKQKNITTILSNDPYSIQESHNQKYEPFKEKIDSLANESDKFIDLNAEYQKFPLEKIYTFISENGNKDAGIAKGSIDFAHPNQLGNAYIAKVFLEKVFSIAFHPERYMRETGEGEMYPNYSEA